jgi:hypothetical protein
MTLTTDPRPQTDTTSPVPPPKPRESARTLATWAAVIAALVAACVLAVGVLASGDAIDDTGRPDGTQGGAPTEVFSPEAARVSPARPEVFSPEAARQWVPPARSVDRAAAAYTARLRGQADAYAAEQEADARARAAYTARLQGQADAYAASRVG